MNFASQRPLLAKVVHVIGIPPRLYIVHSLQALCTTCGNYLLHSRTCTALKSSQEHHEYGIINSHQRPITACRVLVRMDFGRLCVCCVCAVHTAWSYQWATVYMYCKDTRHHVVCASCFQLIVCVVFLLITAALHGVFYHSYLRLNSRKNVEGQHEVVGQKDLGPMVSETQEFYLRKCPNCLGLLQKCHTLLRESMCGEEVFN